MELTPSRSHKSHIMKPLRKSNNRYENVKQSLMRLTKMLNHQTADAELANLPSELREGSIVSGSPSWRMLHAPVSTRNRNLT